MMQYCTALAINQIYFVFLLFLSGQMAPLALFPGTIQTLAAILPFRWMIGFPVELLLGSLTSGEALTGVGIQTIWVILGFVMVQIIWRAGIRIHSAVGA